MDIMTIGKALEKFLDDRIVYCAPSTLDCYKSHLRVFFRYLEEKYHEPVSGLDFDSIPEEDNILKGFIVWLRSRDTRSVTIRSYCRAVKSFLRFCYYEDICRDYMKGGIKMPKDDSAPKIPLYVSEVNKIDKCLAESGEFAKRNYCMVHLMLDCGLRSQEVRSLRVEDLEPDKNLLHINVSKGNKSRIILCPDFLFTAIYDYLEGRTAGYVLLSVRGKAISQDAIKKVFVNLKKNTGIIRLHPHLLRHTFATSYLLGGGNLEYLRVFLGHYDYTVTKGYSSLAAQCRMLGADIYHLDPIFFVRGY